MGFLPSLGRGWGWGLLLLAVLLLAACKDDDELPLIALPDYSAEQTIIIIQPYTPSLQRALAQNISDIKQNIADHGGLSNTRLMVCQAIGINSATLKELYYFNGTVQEMTVKDYRNFPLVGKENFTTVLTDVKDYVSAPTGRGGAEAFSLIIGCHGMGWVPSATYNHSTRYFGGDSESTHTEVPDLAAAIADADMHMDFILFDDCYMACVEVAYELRAVTDYLLASPAEIMDYGMPYQNLFHFLATRSHDYTSVMTAFEDFYSTYSIPSGTYSAIDCREAEAMAALMKEANENHLFDTSLEPTLQVYDGMKVNGTYKHAFYDLGDYAEKLCGDDATLLGRIQQQVQRLVPFKATTGTFYSKFDGLIQPISIYSGITVSDPTTNNRFTPSLHDTSWWHATHDVS